MTDNNYNCGVCQKKYPRQPEKLKAMLSQKACAEIKANPSLKYKGKHGMTGSPDIVYYKCPANFQDNAARKYMLLYENYEKGQMPYEGGILEQPAKFVDLMELVHNLKNEYQTTKDEQLKKYKNYGK